MMYYGFGHMGGFGMIIPLILLAVIIYAVVRLTQASRGNGNNSNVVTRTERNEALEILNRRYAKGEISDEEYIQKKNIINS